MTMKMRAMARLQRLRDELGPVGVLGAVVLAAAATFYGMVVQPLQDENDTLVSRLSRGEAPGSPAQTADRVGELYKLLERPEETTDWLAKLHAIGAATGLQQRSATYKTSAAGERLQRVEIVLPVTGRYSQLRDFLNRALAEIPVLSLDQMTLRRESRSEDLVHAELHLTLHMVKR